MYLPSSVSNFIGMVHFSFQQNSFEKWLAELSAMLNVPVQHNILQLPIHVGDGYIHAENLFRGLSFVIMNFTLNDDLLLQRQAGGSKGFLLFFNQVKVKDAFEIGMKSGYLKERIPERNNIYLSASDDSLFVRYSKGSIIKRVGIFCSEETVRGFVPPEKYQELSNFTRRELDNINLVRISSEYKNILKEILEADYKNFITHFGVRIRVLELIEKGLLHFFSEKRKVMHLQHITQKEMEQLHKAEELLSMPDTITFPGIESVAAAVLMSPSKLKKMFKEVYGETLYDYYNKIRMSKARELLLTGDLSIREIGLQVGYANLSNFAKNFKQAFGVTPSEYIKSIGN